ncbi:hypothetical protein NDN08_003014 [Rhodosorus marinus]|uniref:Uncharacterized protein n=1 Tax=Rhodosorus marinus TaxID=101924 RepID=A0AAV8V146_9RHOD|nr:hypothetical protein NDN08_003014 [Rhodosorus marinus]
MAFVGSVGVSGVRGKRIVESRRGSGVVCMSAGNDFSRREALSLILGLSAASASTAASAAGFAFSKPGYNGVKLQPGDLELDQDILKSSAVQSKLKNLRALRERVQKLQADFKADGQLDIVSRANGLVEISVLREDLNVVNTVFDEDTQIKTDRVVRAIIEDIFELKGVGALKPGQVRSPKKIEKTEGRLNKMAADLDKLLQFYP